MYNTFNRNEMLATDIYSWCKKNGLWGDNCIYYDGKAIAAWPEWEGVSGQKINDDLYLYENKDPLRYFEYANPKTLSMSFEGPLYRVLNADVRGWTKLEAQFQKLFEKYGYYYELGYSWSLSAYEL